jgi:hypothetical protein
MAVACDLEANVAEMSSYMPKKEPASSDDGPRAGSGVYSHGEGVLRRGGKMTCIDMCFLRFLEEEGI